MCLHPYFDTSDHLSFEWSRGAYAHPWQNGAAISHSSYTAFFQRLYHWPLFLFLNTINAYCLLAGIFENSVSYILLCWQRGEMTCKDRIRVRLLISDLQSNQLGQDQSSTSSIASSFLLHYDDQSNYCQEAYNQHDILLLAIVQQPNMPHDVQNHNLS